MGNAYYTISISTANVNIAAFYQLDPSGDLTIMQGGFTCYPSQSARTSVSIYPQLAQLSFPAADYISGSVTINTSITIISGNFVVSPALNSPVVLTLYGAGGNQIGTATLEAGQTQLQFSWPVTSTQSMTEDEAKNAIAESMKPQQQ